MRDCSGRGRKLAGEGVEVAALALTGRFSCNLFARASTYKVEVLCSGWTPSANSWAARLFFNLAAFFYEACGFENFVNEKIFLDVAGAAPFISLRARPSILQA